MQMKEGHLPCRIPLRLKDYSIFNSFFCTSEHEAIAKEIRKFLGKTGLESSDEHCRTKKTD